LINTATGDETVVRMILDIMKVVDSK